jgi:hypothetical protein
MTPQEFHDNKIANKTMKNVDEWVGMVKDYLADAGFSNEQYYIVETYDSIEVDFDEQEAVFYIIEDIRKTRYKELFVVDYKKPANSKRHTAVFFWLDANRK